MLFGLPTTIFSKPEEGGRSSFLCHSNRLQARKTLLKSVKAYKKKADLAALKHGVGQKVSEGHLSENPLKLTYSSIHWLFIITKIIKPCSVGLLLPTTMWQINPTFHFLQLCQTLASLHADSRLTVNAADQPHLLHLIVTSFCLMPTKFWLCYNAD